MSMLDTINPIHAMNLTQLTRPELLAEYDRVLAIRNAWCTQGTQDWREAQNYVEIIRNEFSERAHAPV